MAVEDTWVLKDGKTHSLRYGRGLRYRVRWHGHSQAFRTKREADAYWLEVRTRKPEPEVSDVTVGELVEKWLATKKGLTPDGYTACVTAAGHVRKRWGSTRAEDVQRDEVEAWLGTMGGSASLRTKALQCLSASIGIGVARKQVTGNPCAEVPRPRQIRHDARFLAPLELMAVESCADGWRPMVAFLGTTGVRVGECVAMNVGDVDVKRRRARVRKSKNGEARDVPVSPRVLAMLDLSRGRDEPLFTSPTGGRVNVNNWRARVFKPAVRASGVGVMRVHDLRHTAASLAIRSGADVKALQRMLGHKSAAMTLDVYGHLWDQGLDDVATRIDGLFGDESGTTSGAVEGSPERAGTTSGTAAPDHT